MQSNDNREVNDNISNNTIRELSANVKSLAETVKSQGEILKTVVDLQENATGSALSCNQNQISSSVIKTTQGNSDSMKVSAVFLLIPAHENSSDAQQIEADGSILRFKSKDHRLQRDLSIQEYIEAFNIFKNIVCEFEDRRVELEIFLQDIIEMATKFKGNIFYEYHKAFAKKAAAIKLTKGLTTDWSIRDEKLYSSSILKLMSNEEENQDISSESRRGRRSACRDNVSLSFNDPVSRKAGPGRKHIHKLEEVQKNIGQLRNSIGTIV
ncbi:unnamed protein product [Mytilus coruscus]|uniref:Uncharacterized protein n=1 Tax=Mytilus coruscus TaxID=42192 RepID=A0A6J8EMF6_MYTCO|nr:unnamed protein product [Mytilus coruscus]